jgi:ATP synthase protein I
MRLAAGYGLWRSGLASNEPGLDPLDEDARLNSLDERLRRARTDEAIRSGVGQDKGEADYRVGSKVLSYLLGGMVGGALVGWTLDRLLGTSPWLLLVLLFLGIISGFRNIIRISSKRS